MKRVIRAESDTRGRIKSLENRLKEFKNMLENPDLDDEDRVYIGQEISRLEEELNFAWQDDEAEYNYAVQQQEFNPDGSLKFYGSTDIKATEGGYSPAKEVADLIDAIKDQGYSDSDILEYFIAGTRSDAAVEILLDMIDRNSMDIDTSDFGYMED